MTEEDEGVRVPYPEVEKLALNSHPGMGSSPVSGMGTPNSDFVDLNQNVYERTDLTPQNLQKNGREIPFNPNSPNVCQQLPEELDAWVKSIIQEYNHKQTPRVDGKQRNPVRYRNMRDFGDGFIVAIIIKVSSKYQNHHCTKNIKRIFLWINIKRINYRL